MTVREIMTYVPAAADIMMEYGLHCFSCSIGGVETLEEGAKMHAMDEQTLEALVEDINDAWNQEPSRPQTITVTEDAAKAIAEIAATEQKSDAILMVVVDEHGGFCLEFQDAPLEGDLPFGHPNVPEIQIYASVITLSRIGGATIDVREGRFKLDLPEDTQCCGGDKEACGC